MNQTASVPNNTSPRVTLVIPTFNEVDNIDPLLNRLTEVLASQTWELIFVDDDSGDGTRDRITQWVEHDHRVRLIHRIGRKGLSSACIRHLGESQPIHRHHGC